MPLPRFISRVTLSSFFLIHDCPQDFVLSKWCKNPLVYAIWATICTIYVISLVIYTAVGSQFGVKILIWLTYWAFYCVALRFCITAFNCWFNIIQQKIDRCANPHFYSLEAETADTTSREHAHYQIITESSTSSDGGSSKKCMENAGTDDEKCAESVCVNTSRQNEQCENNLPARITLQWFVQCISNSVALIVTVLFWSLVYTGEPQDYSGINSHVINSLLVTGDIMISRAPIRIQHFHIPLTYLAIYISFTLVYWAGGGTNHKEQHFIYSVLDYSTRPAIAALAICLIALLGVLLVQIYLYFLYRFRNALYMSPTCIRGINAIIGLHSRLRIHL